MQKMDTQNQSVRPNEKQLDDDDDDELFLWYGWPTKGA